MRKIVNDLDVEGVFVHATTNTDLRWFSPKWTCYDDGDHGDFMLGDAIMFGIAPKGSLNENRNAAWCDWSVADSTNIYFICEGTIDEMTSTGH